MLATTGKQSLAFLADIICAYSGPFFREIWTATVMPPETIDGKLWLNSGKAPEGRLEKVI